MIVRNLFYHEDYYIGFEVLTAVTMISDIFCGYASRKVRWKSADVSEELTASVFRYVPPKY
jgi:hypothetical protein